jgi:hypothetical protein
MTPREDGSQASIADLTSIRVLRNTAAELFRRADFDLVGYIPIDRFSYVFDNLFKKEVLSRSKHPKLVTLQQVLNAIKALSYSDSEAIRAVQQDR